MNRRAAIACAEGHNDRAPGEEDATAEDGHGDEAEEELNNLPDDEEAPCDLWRPDEDKLDVKEADWTLETGLLSSGVYYYLWI